MPHSPTTLSTGFIDEVLKQYQREGSYIHNGLCSAITSDVTICATQEQKKLHLDLLRAAMKPNGIPSSSYWWLHPYDYEKPVYQQAYTSRVIALQLCRELISDMPKVSWQAYERGFIRTFYVLELKEWFADRPYLNEGICAAKIATADIITRNSRRNLYLREVMAKIYRRFGMANSVERREYSQAAWPYGYYWPLTREGFKIRLRVLHEMVCRAYIQDLRSKF